MKDFDQKVIKMYNKENRSTYEIAEILKTYLTKSDARSKSMGMN